MISVSAAMRVYDSTETHPDILGLIRSCREDIVLKHRKVCPTDVP